MSNKKKFIIELFFTNPISFNMLNNGSIIVTLIISIMIPKVNKKIKIKAFFLKLFGNNFMIFIR